MTFQKPLDWTTKEIKVRSIKEFEVPSTKSKGLNIKDQDDNEYTIWQTKQDGSFSQAFMKFQGSKIDESLEINYEEKPGKVEGTVNRTIRTVKRLGNQPATNPNGTFKPGQDITLEDANIPF
jgi:hypothetical protein